MMFSERTRKNKTEPIRYFCLPNKNFSINIEILLGGRQHITLMDIELIQFPMNLDEATTGQKMQGMTKMLIVIADCKYDGNWIYVASSRVTTSNGFFLFKILNKSKFIGPSRALLDEIELLETIETKTLSHLQKNGYFPKDVDVSEGITSTIRKRKTVFNI